MAWLHGAQSRVGCAGRPRGWGSRVAVMSRIPLSREAWLHPPGQWPRPWGQWDWAVFSIN